MVKNSTIGMVLVVAMVLAKAFLFDYDGDQPFVSTQNENAASDASDFANVDAHQPNHITSQSEFLVAQLTTPDVSDFKVVEESSEDFDPNYSVNDLVAINVVNNEPVDEVMPMDVTTNTGYGLWKSPNQEITPREEWEGGKVPLDRGNTITDNISKLFPRTP